MNVWLVIPACGRFPVSRLAFAQQARLLADLAARGITANAVVVADDDNLQLADEHGFHTVEQKNVLGLKVNDGIEYACKHDADWVAFIGSDDWLHADALDPLLDLHKFDKPPILAGHLVTVVDLERGVLRRLGVRGPEGVSPWFIPRWTLEQSRFRPASDTATKGLEGSISLGLPHGISRVFHDPHDLCRVDFKTSVNMTPYDRITRLLGYGNEERAWPVLDQRFPVDLVNLAIETHESLSLEAAA